MDADISIPLSPITHVCIVYIIGQAFNIQNYRTHTHLSEFPEGALLIAMKYTVIFEYFMILDFIPKSLLKRVLLSICQVPMRLL